MTQGITKSEWDNYAERVDILTELIGGVLETMAGNPMIATMAGEDFVRDVQNMLTRLRELKAGNQPVAIPAGDGG